MLTWRGAEWILNRTLYIIFYKSKIISKYKVQWNSENSGKTPGKTLKLKEWFSNFNNFIKWPHYHSRRLKYKEMEILSEKKIVWKIYLGQKKWIIYILENGKIRVEE